MTKPTRRDSRVLDAQLLRAVCGGDSKYNQKETLASSILKKADDTTGGVINKLG